MRVGFRRPGTGQLSIRLELLWLVYATQVLPSLLAERKQETAIRATEPRQKRDTKPFRDQLAKGFDLGDLFRVCLCYTPTNAALLTCLAGLAGGISSRLTYDRFVEDPLGIEATEKLTVADVLVRTENPVASMLRSFIVYFIFVAGLALASPQNPFSEPTRTSIFGLQRWYRFLGLSSITIHRFSIASFANSLGYASSNRNRPPSKRTGHQQHDHDEKLFWFFGLGELVRVYTASGEMLPYPV